MATSTITSGSEVPRFDSPEQYAAFMRSKAGSRIKPGSEAERVALEGFLSTKRERGNEENQARTERIRRELKLKRTDGDYVRPEESQDIHRGNSAGEMDVQAEIGDLDADLDTDAITPTRARGVGHEATSQLVSRPSVNHGIQGPQRADVNPAPPVNPPLQMRPRGL